MSKLYKDHTGKKYGRLTFLKATAKRSVSKEILWKLKCDCGKTTISIAANVINGKTKSCGCLHKETITKDYTNKKYNMLTFIKPIKKRHISGSILWKLKCDCGNTIQSKSYNITNNIKKHCGCLNTNKITKKPKRCKHKRVKNKLKNGLIRKCANKKCTKDSVVLGYCQLHYRRWKINGTSKKIRHIKPKQKCSIKNCNENARTKTYCNTHYERFRAHGNPNTLLWPHGKIRKQKEIRKEICKVNNCNNKHMAQGYCNKHYQRVYVHGDHNTLLRAEPGSGFISQGYKLFVIDGRRICEHRLFMENHIGRRLTAKENVHHRNGDRLDNSIGPCALDCECKCKDGLHNLELWSTHQPPGQRIKDKLKWAHKLIEQYEQNNQQKKNMKKKKNKK